MTEQAALFEPEKSVEATDDSARFDWYAEYCRTTYELAPDWEVWKWETVNYDKPGTFVMVEGAVCKERFTKGKRKGRINYKKHEPGTLLKFPILDADLNRFKAEWSARTGKCARCYGTGKQWSGWDHIKGTRYIDCKDCGATGAVSITQAERS